MGYDEASVLRAFDDNRNAVHIAAMRAYKRERKGFYELGAPIFDGFVRGFALHDCHREKDLAS
jgi:hypothetical protein